jgi:hypothetical protein
MMMSAKLDKNAETAKFFEKKDDLWLLEPVEAKKR